MSKVLREETLTAGGGTITITAVSGVNFLKLIGAATFSSSWTVTSSGTFGEGKRIEVFVNGTFDFNGNNLTILGKVIPSYLQALPFWVIATWNGSSWDSYLVLDPTAGDTITGAGLVADTLDINSLANNAITLAKLPSIARGSIFRGDASANAEIHDASGNGWILVGDGNDINSVMSSGDVIIASDGSATIQPGVIEESMLGFEVAGAVAKATYELNISQIQALNATPIQILSDALVGAGFAVKVHGYAVSMTYDSAALSFAADLEIQSNTGVVYGVIPNTKLNGGASNIWTAQFGSTEVDIVDGSGLRLQAKTSNPTGGAANTTLKVTVLYSLIPT